jgi:hypothetical protein
MNGGTMNHTLEQLRAMPDRELECMLARVLYKENDNCLEVRGEHFWTVDREDDSKSWERRPVPLYTRDWKAIGEAVERLYELGFDVDLYGHHRQVECWAQVTDRWVRIVAEATEKRMGRALAIAAVLGVQELWGG